MTVSVALSDMGGGVSLPLSVTHWYCVKTNNHRIVRFWPPDYRPTATLVFSVNFHTLRPSNF